MKIKNEIINNKILFLIILVVISIFALRSLTYLSHIYDGVHHGSIFQNSLEILNGQLPYKDYFSQYGHLNDLINSFTVKILNYDIFGLYINTTLFYFLAVFIIGYIAFTLSNIYAFLISIIILIFNHPIPEYPWPNYTAFLFLTFSVLVFNENKKQNLFLSSFFLGLSILCRENFYFFIIPTWLLLSLLIYIRYRNFLKFGYFILGLILPISFFLFFLVSNNIFDFWLNFQKLPFIYVERYETTTKDLIISFFSFFSNDVIFNLVEKPQYLAILIIYLFCLFVFFEEIFIKKFNKLKIVFICLLSLSSFIVSINYEIFRLYTSITIGLPIIFYRLNLLKSKDTSFIYIFVLIFISVYSLIYYPKGNIKFYKNIDFKNSYQNKDLIFFKNQKWTNDKWIFNENFSMIDKKISKTCNVNYILNLTPNAFILSLSNLKRIQVSHIFNDHLGLDFALLLQENFHKKVYDLMENENIYIITTENNIKILNTKLNNYLEIKSINFYDGKEILYRVLVPKTCYNKL